MKTLAALFWCLILLTGPSLAWQGTPTAPPSGGSVYRIDGSTKGDFGKVIADAFASLPEGVRTVDATALFGDRVSQSDIVVPAKTTLLLGEVTLDMGPNQIRCAGSGCAVYGIRPFSNSGDGRNPAGTYIRSTHKCVVQIGSLDQRTYYSVVRNLAIVMQPSNHQSGICAFRALFDDVVNNWIAGGNQDTNNTGITVDGGGSGAYMGSYDNMIEVGGTGIVTRNAATSHNWFRGNIAGNRNEASQCILEQSGENYYDIDCENVATGADFEGGANFAVLRFEQVSKVSLILNSAANTIIAPSGLPSMWGDLRGRNTVIWPGNLLTGRVSQSGTTPSAQNFVLSAEWGKEAAVGGIEGADSGLRFRVTSGSSPSANPSISYTFADGAWPKTSPICLAQTSDSSDQFPAVRVTPSSTGVVLTPQFKPLPNTSYVFSVRCDGVN